MSEIVKYQLDVVMCDIYREYLRTAGSGSEILNDLVTGDGVAGELVGEIMEAFVVAHSKIGG